MSDARREGTAELSSPRQPLRDNFRNARVAAVEGRRAAQAMGCQAADSFLVEFFGWIGCVAAWLLFLSPVPTVFKIWRRGSVGDFSALPYLVSTLQCGLWSVYSLPFVTPCKMQPLVTNVVGFALEIQCARAAAAPSRIHATHFTAQPGVLACSTCALNAPPTL